MTIPLALFASSYNEDEADGSTIQNSKSSYTPVKNNKSNYNLGNNDNNNNSNDYSKNKNSNLRKTIKHKQTAPNESKLAALLKSMDESDSENDDDNSNLANYKSVSENNMSGLGSGSGSGPVSGSGAFPPLPEVSYKGPSSSTSVTNPSHKNNSYTTDIPTASTGAISTTSYDDMPSTYANQYYKQFVPYLNQSSSEVQNQPAGDLMEKVNYIIDLLEDQKDYKTNSIFEDLILYAFLGIFVIFIVDSFSRSGKYVR